MRSIKFRGLRTDGEGWVIGDLSTQFQGDERCFISVWEKRKGEHGKYYWSHVGYEVIPETVGQFTGLTDKNGKEIYEGDKLRYHQHDEFIVSWDTTFLGFSINGSGTRSLIIGNIHEESEVENG